MASLRSLPRADLAIAGILAAYGLGEALLLRAPASWLLGVLVVTLPLAWRRRFPAAVIGTVLLVVLIAGGLGMLPAESVLPLPLILVSAYTVGREAPSGSTALLGALAVMGTLALGQLIKPAAENTAVEDLVAAVILVGGATGAGRVMRLRQAENRELEDLADRLAAERDLRARVAVVEERARMARELHDVVAHSLSLIAVQAGAAAELMGRDEARARSWLTAVQSTAGEALGEMRRLLSVLRADGDEPELAPQPGLAAVAQLVDRVRESGLPVALREEGTRPDVPAGVGLSAFRIVQEALTNVRKHAGAVPTEVLVRYAPDAVVLEVSNADGRTSHEAVNGSPGHGMVGMQERTRLYGGTLDVRRRDGRYVVHARLPLAPPVR